MEHFIYKNIQTRLWVPWKVPLSAPRLFPPRFQPVLATTPVAWPLAYFHGSPFSAHFPFLYLKITKKKEKFHDLGYYTQGDFILTILEIKFEKNLYRI
jgi:hypothetical protein